MIEGRHGADHADHHGHRVRIAAETAVQVAQLLVDHRVVDDGVLEVVQSVLLRQFLVQEQVADLQEAAVLGQFLDGVAAVTQDADFAVDIGQLGIAACGRGIGRVVGEHAGLCIETAHIDDFRAFGALEDRQLDGLAVNGQGRGAGRFRLGHFQILPGECSHRAGARRMRD